MQHSLLFQEDDSYLCIAEATEAEYKVKFSKFLGFAFPLQRKSDIEECLARLRSLHPKATHHCYAYRIDTNDYRANDDGEPSSTAGRPILGQIDKRQLRWVLIVVIRYYGGIKLGVAGLRDAYKIAAEAALEKAQLIERIVERSICISFPYNLLGKWMSILNQEPWAIRSTEYEAELVSIEIRSRLSHLSDLLDLLKEGKDEGLHWKLL